MAVWRDRGRLFDDVAEQYRDDRPGYPSALWDVLVQRTGLGPGTRVLEVGAGAGQATLPLASLGASVRAVEPGVQLAEVLRARTVGLDVEVVAARLEDAVLAPASVDLAVAATSFHWVDPGVGATILGAALRPQGWLALWWNVYGDPARPDPFVAVLDAALEEGFPQLAAEGPIAGTHAFDVAARTAELDASGLFGPVEHLVVPWTGRHRPDELRRMFATFSPWLALPTGERERALDLVELAAWRSAPGGVVERPYRCALYLAQRR